MPVISVITMYSRYLRVRIIPSFPAWKVSTYSDISVHKYLTLSSKDEKPKYELDLTSLRHFAHL